MSAPRVSSENVRAVIGYLEEKASRIERRAAARRKFVYDEIDRSIADGDERAYDAAVVRWLAAVCEVGGIEMAARHMRDGVEKLKLDLARSTP